jgi:hypothetical protein
MKESSVTASNSSESSKLERATACESLKNRSHQRPRREDMTRPDDRAQLEFLINQGYRVLVCCPREHHEIEVAMKKDEPCKEKSSGKVPYDVEKRCHMGNWQNTPGLTIEQLRRLDKIKPTPNVGLKLDIGIIRLDIDGEAGEVHIAEFSQPRGSSPLVVDVASFTGRRKTRAAIRERSMRRSRSWGIASRLLSLRLGIGVERSISGGRSTRLRSSHWPMHLSGF